MKGEGDLPTSGTHTRLSLAVEDDCRAGIYKNIFNAIVILPVHIACYTWLASFLPRAAIDEHSMARHETKQTGRRIDFANTYAR